MKLDAMHETEEATMLLAYAIGGATDVSLHVKAYTWEGFCDRLTSPRVGNKDGSYYIRGGKLRAPKRSDENLIEAELLILDADSTFDPHTGEVTSGAPPLPIVADALNRIGLTYVAHTSHSARPQDQFWKYRIVFPAKLKSVEELNDCLDFLIAQLHGMGIYIADVMEARRWSQPWFLPRVRTEADKQHFVAARNDGLPFDVVAALEWAQGRRKAEEAIHAAKTSQRQPAPLQVAGEGHDGIRAFNDAASLDLVRDTLEAAGYKFGYFDRRQQSYRYMRPGSESKTCGLVVFKGSQGHWCTYSHHGNADPLSHKVCDPFELATILRFGGDRKAAARALIPRKKEPSIVEQISSRQMEGHAQAVNHAQPQQPEPASPPNDFHLEHWAKMQDKPVRWLIKDIIPAGGFAALFGKPGTFKSFVAIYLAACISCGDEAFGQETEQTGVVYVAGEGGFGMSLRMKALKKVHDTPEDAPIYFLRRQINLRSSLDDATKLVEAIKALNIDVGLVVIDTLARAFAGGNENASEDMGAFMAIVAEVQRLLNCAALIVHHSGKDEARGMRGHSSLFGAIDAEIEVLKMSQDGAETRIGQLRTSKQKDGEDNLTFLYKLPLVVLSDIDPDLTSLVVEPISQAEAEALGAKRSGKTGSGKTRNKPSKVEEMALETLQLALDKKGVEPMFDQMKDTEMVVLEDVWSQFFADKYAQKSTRKTESAARSWRRAKNELYKTGQIKGFNQYVWISNTYDEADK